MPSHDFVTPVFTWPRAAQSGSMLPPHVLNQLLLQTTETTPLVLQGTKVCGSVGRDTRLPRACGSVSFCARTSFGYRQQVNRTWCCLFVLQSLSSSHTEEGSSFWEPFFKAFSLVHLHPSGLLRAPRSPWTLTTSFWFNFSVKIMLKGGSFMTFGIVSCFTRINTFFGGGLLVGLFFWDRVSICNSCLCLRSAGIAGMCHHQANQRISKNAAVKWFYLFSEGSFSLHWIMYLKQWTNLLSSHSHYH